MYDDDVMVMAPSPIGLSMLLSVWSDYGIEHDSNTKYNRTKSNVMICCCERF